MRNVLHEDWPHPTGEGPAAAGSGRALRLAALLPLAENLNMFDPASPQADSIKGLFILVLAITGVIFLLVNGMLLYCIVRFRQRPDSPPTSPRRSTAASRSRSPGPWPRA